MGGTILEYITVGGIFLVAVIQRRKIFEILRQNKRVTKSKDNDGGTKSPTSKTAGHLNKEFSLKSYTPVYRKFKFRST